MTRCGRSSLLIRTDAKMSHVSWVSLLTADSTASGTALERGGQLSTQPHLFGPGVTVAVLSWPMPGSGEARPREPAPGRDLQTPGVHRSEISPRLLSVAGSWPRTVKVSAQGEGRTKRRSGVRRTQGPFGGQTHGTPGLGCAGAPMPLGVGCLFSFWPQNDASESEKERYHVHNGRRDSHDP